MPSISLLSSSIYTLARKPSPKWSTCLNLLQSCIVDSSTWVMPWKWLDYLNPQFESVSDTSITKGSALPNTQEPATFLQDSSPHSNNTKTSTKGSLTLTTLHPPCSPLPQCATKPVIRIILLWCSRRERAPSTFLGKSLKERKERLMKTAWG